MIYLYDNSLLSKIRNWVGDPDITITGPDDTNSLFTYRADQSEKDQIKLPLITLSRMSPITLETTNKKPLSFRSYKYRGDENNISTLNGIPINLKYQLDIYTRHRRENDDILREFIFKIINNPTLKIEIPFNSDKDHVFNMRLENNIDDNSDIPEHLINGEYFRSTLVIYVDDAYLFEYKTKDTYKINADLELVDKLEILDDVR